MNTQEIIQEIEDRIYTNPQQLITGDELQGILKDVVNNEDLFRQTGVTGVTVGKIIVAGATGGVVESDYSIEDLCGATGATGAIGVTGAIGATGPQGITGEIGPQGVTGPKGEAGTSIAIKATESDCTYIGDCYIDDNGHLQILESLSPREFHDSGEIKGPQGVTGVGIQGVTGLPGRGGVRGPQGYQGVTGERGPEGPHGGIGPQGVTGSMVTYTQNYQGTDFNIGTITIDGVSTTIYIPSTQALEQRIQELETRIAVLESAI